MVANTEAGPATETIIAKFETEQHLIVVQKMASDEWRVVRVDNGTTNYEGNGKYVYSLKRAKEVFFEMVNLSMEGY